MATVTRLHGQPRGRVAVEVDGALWRVVPVEVVVGAGISVGGELDRPTLRRLRRELRRNEALSAAARELRRRDLSSHVLADRLERRGVAAQERAEVVETLERAGLVDDDRFACARAAALAERGRGDAAIRWDLETKGLPGELVDRALASIDPEHDRARRILARRGRGAATARLLAARGFGEEAVEWALSAAAGADDEGALG